MNIVTVDFETYYDSEYSLRKMTTIEYIMSPMFQPIMMSYAINDEPIRTAIGYPQIRDVLASIDWNNTILNAQNTIFDGTIIKQRFGYEARYYADTMAMARVTGAHIFDGASLDAIAKVLQAVGYAVPPKGKAVTSASGKRLYDMYETKPYLAEHSLTNPADVEQAHQLLKAYQEYCENDVLLAKQAFLYFSSLVTPSEMMYSDMILKCYILPQMKLDLPIIQEEIKRIEIRDVNRATDVANKYFEGSIPALRATCRSAVKFTEFLHQLGGRLEYELGEDDDYYFLIPYKYSEKKGKNEPCYSKSYAGMMEMCDHPDPNIADIFKMKLAMTSSIEMSRAKRFESIAQLDVGFGMPYSVSGAHTHRLGGSGGLNVQNLSSGRKEGQSNALKRSITAPEGYKVVVFDSSQIELRTGAFIANDQNTLDLFRTGKDPYSVQAAQLYGGDPDEIKKNAKAHIEPFAMQRQLAKSALLSCIYGTGAGGFENYLKVNGLHQTPDECKFIVNNYRQTHPEIVRMWKECERALNGMLAGDSGYFGGADGQLFFYDGSRKVHARVVPGIRLPDGNWLNYYNLRQEPREYPDGSVSMNYAYTGLKEGRIKTIYTYEGLICKSIQPCVKIDGVLMTSDHKILTTKGWETANDFISKKTSQLQRLNRTAVRYASRITGEQVSKGWVVLDLPVRLWQSVRETYNVLNKRSETWGDTKLRLFNQAFNIAREHEAQPFTSPHLCGVAEYEMSLPSPKTQSVEKLWGTWDKSLRPMASVVQKFCGRYASNILGRSRFRQNRQRWGLHTAELSLGKSKAKLQQPTEKCQNTGRWGLSKLPSAIAEVWNSSINYMLSLATRDNNARVSEQTRRFKKVYDIADCGSRNRFVVRGKSAPFIVHNCNQALAFSIMKYQAMLVNEWYRVALNTHDEWGIVVPDAEVEQASEYMAWCMRQVPDWAKGLPVDCEGNFAQHYGDCK